LEGSGVIVIPQELHAIKDELVYRRGRRISANEFIPPRSHAVDQIAGSGIVTVDVDDHATRVV
jgi:hypothetical protein